MGYIVREYRRDDVYDAELLADMWNKSDSGWPGGWTRGIPETAERTLENMQKIDRLGIYVVEYDGEIVGYGDFRAQAGQKEVAYLQTLNARPDHHGKGVGKRLVLRILEKTIELGYKQLTIGTWPGNTKAVPLYKKTGFFWVPETDVFMQNYIPTILSLPIARDFFAKHDWYQCQKRDLAIAPDEIEWNGVKVFPYHFEADGEVIKVTTDKQSESITAIETNDLSVACYTGLEDVPTGLEHPVKWKIENRRDKPLQITLIAQGEEGIALDVLENLLVTDKTTIEKTFSVSPEIKEKDWGEPAHKITSTLMINGEPLSLATAVKPVQPIDIEYNGQTVVPGKKNERVVVKLRNRLNIPVEGKLIVDPRPGLKLDKLSDDFSLPAKSWTSCPFWAQIDEAGAFQTKMRVEGTSENGEIISTKAQTVVFRAIPFGKIVTSVNEDRKSIRLETDSMSVELRRSGGRMYVRDKIAGRGCCGQEMAELGPPFAGWRRMPPTYEYRLEERDGEAAITLIAPSDMFPEMVVEKKITFTGSPAIKIEHRVINNSMSAQKFKLRLHSHAQLRGRLTLPTKNGLLHQVTSGWGSFPEGETDASKKPEDYAETWSACEDSVCVVGMVWPACEENEFGRGLPHLQFDLPEIPPQSYIDLEPLYIIAGRGNWEMVRKYWRWLYQPSEIIETRKPVKHPILEVGFENKPLFVANQEIQTKVSVTNNRGKALNAKLNLEIRSAKTQFSHRSARTEFSPREITGVNRDNPFEQDTSLTYSDLTPHSEEAKFFLKTDVETQEFTAPIVILGDSDSGVKFGESEKTLTLDNGFFKLKIAPEFLGSVIALERDGVNHLMTAYPNERPFVWINPWHGGIHPVIGWIGDTRFAKEQFSGEQISRLGKNGIRWHGYKLTCDVEHQDYRWFRREIEYLTIGGSNLIALVNRCINKTDAPMGTDSGVAAWLQPGGTTQNTILHYEQSTPLYGQNVSTDMRERRRRHRHRGGYLTEFNCGKWAAVENPETNDVFIMITSYQQGELEAMDLVNDGAHLYASTWFGLEANETKEDVTWLVLCDSLEEALAYRVLSEAWELP